MSPTRSLESLDIGHLFMGRCYHLSPTLICSSTMTNISSDQSDFDFWEFVSCAKCQLSFSLDAGVAVPFWLTQCGHVICNNHLSLQFSATPQGFLVLMLVYSVI